MGIPHNEWDMLLIGDGSGSKYDYPIGWGCVELRPNKMERKVYWGGANDGTVNIAEALAYMVPLAKFASEVHEAAKESKRGMQAKNVHIITDSLYVRGRGSSIDNVNFKKHASIFAAYQMFQRQGIFLHWHHAPREDVALNVVADILSKEARKLFVESDHPPASIRTDEINLQDCNPWD